MESQSERIAGYRNRKKSTSPIRAPHLPEQQNPRRCDTDIISQAESILANHKLKNDHARCDCTLCIDIRSVFDKWYGGRFFALNPQQAAFLKANRLANCFSRHKISRL